MLTSDEARKIASRWWSQFSSGEAYSASVARYLERIAAPARSTEGLERWLREDLEQENVRRLLLEPEQVRPEGRERPEQPEWCWPCGRSRVEAAGTRCTNPRWHDPNEREPGQSPVRGWSSVAEIVR